MTQLKLKTTYLTKFKEEFIVKYGELKQEVLDKQKVLNNMKSMVLEVFDDLNTSMIEITKLPKYKGTTISKITRESSYAVKGDGTKLLDANKQPILISGRIDTKKLKEKYPNVYADCLKAVKSVEIKYDIKKVGK
jgi:predicted phage-related endonuclease|tara:strand:- start:128 stop:532 length:405 start_codon:yes stop_codon:yes gene_type:complete